MKNLSIQIKSIIDFHIEESKKILDIEYKDDGSLVSSADIKIQNDLVDLFTSYFKEDILFIGEEGFKEETLDMIDTNFCIIDPIDGTENFLSGLPIYGSTISIVLGKREYHFIYVPSLNIVIDSFSLESIKTPSFRSDIELFSTKCLNQNFNNIDNARVMGSSSYMFYLFLTKQVKSYKYCVGAKVWDCYTGIALARNLGANISMKYSLDDWLAKPRYKTEFELKWDKGVK